MNQLDMLTILVDSCRQLPETKHLNAAIKQAEKRREVLKARYDRRRLSLDAKKLVASCTKCGQLLAKCNCWDHATNTMRRAHILGTPVFESEP